MRVRLRPFDAAAVKRELKRRAAELGAADLRVVAAFADAESRERMHASFARGDLATWGYDAAYAQTAADPSAVLPGARSIVCIAVPYATAPPERAPLSGRVSNYAWSDDYHRRVRTLLRDLAAMLDEIAGEPVTAVACDTKPIAERAFAARAGLGWVGKHTNLISPELGSFIFLGEIVTTLDLAADAPLQKSCGSCSRCIDACPTGALRGDYTIDANRCISDLTQRTGSIPRDMRALIGDWVWGCDVCQVACPPTARAGLQGDAAAVPRDGAAAPDLLALLRLRSGEFKRRFAPTAMGWRGAAVLRRNAAVALGNALDRSAVPGLLETLRDDPHPMVRGHAAWALGRLASKAALDGLREASIPETDAGVREEIAAALEPHDACAALGRV
jgi:epoxyqueuosine reductase